MTFDYDYHFKVTASWCQMQSYNSTKDVLLFIFIRYNPENLYMLEKYIELLSKENTYDLEAALAVLKL